MAANPFRRLMEVLAGSSQAQLRRQVQYLKAENEVLRSKIKSPVRVSPRERARLVRLAKPLLGPALTSLVSIVQPETIRRWIREASRKPKRRATKARRRPGRPRTPAEVRALILRMARDNAWGYTRILGELKKLGIKVARGTVANILREEGLPTGPARGESTWDEFLHRHAKTLWACDFVHVRTLTLRGFKYAYALVFIHPQSRRVIVSSSTLAPNAAWVAEQATAFVQAATASGATDPPRILLRDGDTKFAESFSKVLRTAGIKPKRLPHRAPNLNAYAERFIQTLRTECLDRFIVCGTGHLDHLTSEFVEHYLHERPHMALELRCPAEPPGTPGAGPGHGPVRPSDIVCSQRLGGVLRHYHLKRAA